MWALRFVAILLAIAFTTPSFGQSLALTMSKSFTPSSVQVGGTQTTTMTVTVTNPNSFTVTGIGFSDTYPAGLVPDLIGSYTCGPGFASFNGSGWAFSGVTLGPGASCSVPILMHATTVGSITNTTSSVTGTGVPTGGPASAALNVAAAPLVIVPTPALSPEVLLALAAMLSLLGAMRLRGSGYL
ncbi:hypothetical protein [Dokdonella soli]|uniref:DUF7933 domain-containing protein n=1 Tax=Dokdonella soli TaxID=529810 RepID=A0ABN1IZH3_9GAMM